MTAAVGMLPEKKLGVVVLTNMDHTPLADGLMRYIFNRHLGAPVRDYAGEANARALAHGPLEYWNANNFRSLGTASIPAVTMYDKFEVGPDDKVTGVHSGLAPDVALLGRKAASGGRR